MVLGQIRNLTVDLEEKDSSFKFNSNPTNGIELNKLTIFIGTNGSGKSMIMKLTWLCNFIMFSRLAAKDSPAEKEYVETDYFMEMCFSKTFRNAEDLDCKVKAQFECGSVLSFHYKNGDLVQYDINLQEGVDDGIKPIYLSSTTRLLTSIEDYISFKKDLNEYVKDEEKIAKKLLEKYILPDLTYLEFRSHQLQNGITIPSELGDRLVKDYEFDYKPLLVYLEDDKIHLRSDKGIKKLNSIGSGHQALLTMLLPLE